MRNRARSLLWWLPALVVGLAAGLMPDTFLDNPYSTIPHETAFVLRFWLVIIDFGYIALVLITRMCLHLSRTGAARGFAVIPPPSG